MPFVQEYQLDWMEKTDAEMNLLALHYIESYQSLVGIFQLENLKGTLSIQIWLITIDEAAEPMQLVGADLTVNKGLVGSVSAYDLNSDRLFVVLEYCNGSRMLASLSLGVGAAWNDWEQDPGMCWFSLAAWR